MYNCFIKFLIGYLGMPSLLNYVTDVILVIILVYYVWMKADGSRLFIPTSLKVFVGIYFCTTVISYFLNLYSPLLYIWGFRNNMRFVLFAMMCAVFLKRKDIHTIFDILFGYFILNIIAVTYEFFFAGKIFHTGDTISGLYSMGDISGGNGALNWLLCIVCTAAIVQYFHNEKTLAYLMFCISGSIYMAALSELKVFFMELVLISVLAVLIGRKSMKMLTYMIICVAAVVVGINMLYRYFPQFDNFFTIETMKAYLGGNGYIDGGSINRMTAVPYVFTRFLKTLPQKLFGIGFGNADYSKFSFFTSDFYMKYRWTAYQWFYCPMILIETGIAGFTAFILMLGNYFRQAVMMKSVVEKDFSLKCIAMILCILSVIMLFYDQSLKMETSGYLVHALLCIPYIAGEKRELMESDRSIFEIRNSLVKNN